MSQRRVTVGTTPVQIAPPNDLRIGIVIEYVPSSIETGNTGFVGVTKDGPPTNTTGQPNSGTILQESDIYQDKQSFSGDESVHHGSYWAISDTADQVLVVDDITSRVK